MDSLMVVCVEGGREERWVDKCRKVRLRNNARKQV